MTVAAAFEILNLQPNASARDLVLAYRRLVKRYHPDYNATRQTWSTEKMTQLNLAYETAREVIASRDERQQGRPGASASDGGDTAAGYRNSAGTTFEEREEQRRAAFEHARWAGGRAALGVSPQFARLFDKPWDLIVDGVYVFYQYGLENVHLRNEGVHRFRYRRALKNLKDGIAALEPLEEDIVTEADATRLAAANGFSKAFLQNMLIEKYYIPTRVKSELKAYKHYHNGSRHLDHAIKDRFCSQLSRTRDIPASAGILELVQHELITVIAKYTDSTWVPESMIKMHLLDRFNAVMEAKLTA